MLTRQSGASVEGPGGRTALQGAVHPAGKRRIGAAFTTSARPANVAGMIELMRTNDAVVISFVESLMRDAGIECLVADQNMSIMEGSIGALPRRVLVEEDEAERARVILRDAGVGD